MQMWGTMVNIAIIKHAGLKPFEPFPAPSQKQPKYSVYPSERQFPTVPDRQHGIHKMHYFYTHF